MKWIAHRGNMNGPSNHENDPSYIKETLSKSHDVEIDIWLKQDGFYSGHDEPTYKITRQFLQNQRLWVHCKNIEAYLDLFKIQNINCFYQSSEEIVATSRGYLWAHSKCNQWNNKTILTHLDSQNWFPPKNIFGVCSDYIMASSVMSFPFDLLIIDIDGVMTDGTKIYDCHGQVSGKNYCDLDFTAIKRFKAAGIQVCFLSGDKIINEKMAATRKIDFFHNPPGTDKIDFLTLIKNHYHSTKIAYVGDDYYDLAIMNAVDLSFCPNNSLSIIQRAARAINVSSGKGVIAGLYDMYENEIPYAFPLDSVNVNPK